MPVLFVCLFLASASFSQINSTRFKYVSIDVPGATITEVRGINNFGEIVGYYSKSNNTGCGFGATCDLHGFTLINKKFTTIDIPGALQTEIYGVNDGGDVVGAYFTSDGHLHGFLLHHNGQLQHIDVPGTNFTSANAVNNSLTVVGQADKGFVWKNGKFTTFDITVPGNGESQELLGISNTGIIAGTIFRQDFFNGFQKTGTDLDVFARVNGLDTHVNGVNARGDLVGEAFGGTNSFVAYHQESNETNEKNEALLRLVSISFPGSTRTTPRSINYNQSIVGSWTDSNFNSHGFLAVH